MLDYIPLSTGPLMLKAADRVDPNGISGLPPARGTFRSLDITRLTGKQRHFLQDVYEGIEVRRFLVEIDPCFLVNASGESVLFFYYVWDQIDPACALVVSQMGRCLTAPLNWESTGEERGAFEFDPSNPTPKGRACLFTGTVRDPQSGKWLPWSNALMAGPSLIQADVGGVQCHSWLDGVPLSLETMYTREGLVAQYGFAPMTARAMAGSVTAQTGIESSEADAINILVYEPSAIGRAQINRVAQVRRLENRISDLTRPAYRDFDPDDFTRGAPPATLGQRGTPMGATAHRGIMESALVPPQSEATVVPGGNIRMPINPDVLGGAGWQSTPRELVQVIPVFPETFQSFAEQVERTPVIQDGRQRF